MQVQHMNSTYRVHLPNIIRRFTFQTILQDYAYVMSNLPAILCAVLAVL